MMKKDTGRALAHRKKLLSYRNWANSPSQYDKEEARFAALSERFQMLLEDYSAACDDLQLLDWVEEATPSASDAECGVPLGRSGHIQFVCRLPLGHEGSHRNAAVPGPETTESNSVLRRKAAQRGEPDPFAPDEGMTESISHEAVPDVERPAEMDGMYWAWTIIANAYGGDWDNAPAEWVEAAQKWRDEAFHSSLKRSTPSAGSTAPISTCENCECDVVQDSDGLWWHMPGADYPPNCIPNVSYPSQEKDAT